MAQRDIYDPAFVAQLFNEMAQTYGVVNLVSSLGFARRWRRQCLRSIEIPSGATVVDLMTGMGELCPDLIKFVGFDGAVRALDISPVMCDYANRHLSTASSSRLQVIQANALNCPIADESVDCVVSTFGLKTFSAAQLRELASEVFRVLRPGGRFAFLEISVPRHPIIRWPYMVYLNHVIPLIGRLALGNPDNYRLLGVYTSAFQNCRATAECFSAAGLEVEFRSYFLGCATGITGVKQVGDVATATRG